MNLARCGFLMAFGVLALTGCSGADPGGSEEPAMASTAEPNVKTQFVCAVGMNCGACYEAGIVCGSCRYSKTEAERESCINECERLEEECNTPLP